MERSKVCDELKKHAPTSLKVTLRDGTDKPVGVPKDRNRWSRVQQVLDSVPWVAIECLDKDGRLLRLVEDDEELADLEDDDAPDDTRLARLLLEVMRTTMKESRLMTDVQMRAMSTTMQAMADGQQALVETYRTALQAQQQHLLVAGQSPSENAEMMQMLQMAVGLVQQQAAKKVGG